MGSRRGGLAGWQWLLLGVFAAAATIGAIRGLFAAAVATKEFFAALAALALFLPITAMAVTHIPAIARRIGGAAKASTPWVATVLVGCLSLALAAAAISGAIAWFVDGVTEFETGTTHRYLMPVPVFVIAAAVLSLLLAVLAAKSWRVTREQRR